MEKYIFITDYQAQPKVQPTIFKKGEVVEGDVSQIMSGGMMRPGGGYTDAKIPLLKFDKGNLGYTIPLGLNSPLEKVLMADLPKTNLILMTGKTEQDASNNIAFLEKKTKTVIISVIVGMALLYGAYRLGKRK